MTEDIGMELTLAGAARCSRIGSQPLKRPYRRERVVEERKKHVIV